MAIDAKVSFIEQMEKSLAGVLTVEQMERMRKAAEDIMDHFDMVEIRMMDASDDDLLQCYIDAMKVQNRSQKTIARYEYEIRRMMDYVKVPTRRISVYHLRNYLAKEQARGVKDTTLEGLRQIYSAYFNWLQREALIEKNPTANLGSIKCAKREKKKYTEIEIAKLIDCCTGIRDRAIIQFLASTGCRVSEMTQLNRDDVHLDKLECVVHGKGNKERTVFLSEVAGEMIRTYLMTRKDDEEALFVGIRNERLQPNGVRTMLNALAKKAGVEHAHPHKFRRTLATELTRRGMPIQEVARILGHEKIDTTMKYVNMDHDFVKTEYRRYA